MLRVLQVTYLATGLQHHLLLVKTDTSMQRWSDAVSTGVM